MCINDFPKLFCNPGNKKAIEYIQEWMTKAENTFIEIIEFMGETEDNFDAVSVSFEGVDKQIKDINERLDKLDDFEKSGIPISKLQTLIDNFTFEDELTFNGRIDTFEKSEVATDDELHLVVKDANNKYGILAETFNKKSTYYLSGEGVFTELPSLSITDITYAELLSAIEKSTLIPGQYYCITDYNGFIYNDNGFTKIAADENKNLKYNHIIVQALTATSLKKDAYYINNNKTDYFTDGKEKIYKCTYNLRLGATSHQICAFCSDSYDYIETAEGFYRYFYHIPAKPLYSGYVLLSDTVGEKISNVVDGNKAPDFTHIIYHEKLTIPYIEDENSFIMGHFPNKTFTITDSQTGQAVIITGCYPTSTGWVSELKDDRDNIVPFDYIINYHNNDNVAESYISSASFHNIIKPYVEYTELSDGQIWVQQCLNNIILRGNCIHNFFDKNCTSIELRQGGSYNTFESNCDNIIFEKVAENNSFGTYSRDDTFKEEVMHNKFGKSFKGNTFDVPTGWNVIGDRFADNAIAASACLDQSLNMFSKNTFGGGCRENLIVCGIFRYNVIGDQFTHNSIKPATKIDADTGNEIIPESCYIEYNTFGNNVLDNEFVRFKNNSVGDFFTDNYIKMDGCTIGDHFQENNTRVTSTTSKTANILLEGGLCTNSTFGNHVTRNVITGYDGLNMCDIGDHCSDNTFGEQGILQVVIDPYIKYAIIPQSSLPSGRRNCHYIKTQTEIII